MDHGHGMTFGAHDQFQEFAVADPSLLIVNRLLVYVVWFASEAHFLNQLHREYSIPGPRQNKTTPRKMRDSYDLPLRVGQTAVPCARVFALDRFRRVRTLVVLGKTGGCVGLVAQAAICSSTA